MCNYLQKSFLFFLFLYALPQVYAMENNDLPFIFTKIKPLLDGTKLKKNKRKYALSIAYAEKNEQQTEEGELDSYLSKLDSNTFSNFTASLIEGTKKSIIKPNLDMLISIGNEFLNRSIAEINTNSPLENNKQQEKFISYLSILDSNALNILTDTLLEKNKSSKDKNIVKATSDILIQIAHEFTKRGNEIAEISNSSHSQPYMTMKYQTKDLMNMLFYNGVDISPQDNDQEKINQILAVIQSQNNTNNNSNLLLGYKQLKPEDKDCEKKPQ